MNAPHDWLVPDWPAPAHVQALFTTRARGVSAAPYDSFNLGDHVRDDPVAVATNRQRLADALHARPVFLQQVHGTAVATLDAQTPDGTVADACVSRQPGVACTVMVADCLPVLFSSVDGASVAAVHAGWRGLAGMDGVGVIESLLRQWPAAKTASQRAGLRVWLGPCIGPAAFEVGGDVRQAFGSDDSAVLACFQPVQGKTDKYWANLPALARLRLAASGVHHVSGNDGGSHWCTVSQPSRFFSHRRDAALLGSTGRMAACIGLVI